MEMICITCPKGCTLKVERQEDKLLVTGNSCPRGVVYAENEVFHPMRMITSTVKINGASIARCPVMSSVPIPKEKMFDVMKVIENTTIEAPVFCNQVLIHNICDLDCDLVATRTLKKL